MKFKLKLLPQFLFFNAVFLFQLIGIIYMQIVGRLESSLQVVLATMLIAAMYFMFISTWKPIYFNNN